MERNVNARTGMTVADQIADALKQRILLGELAPGARLRQESIAFEFGASHVPVREAFRRLEAEKLVISEPRRGVRVAALDRKGEREIIEMRSVLEVLALRNVIGKVSAKHLAAVEAALQAGNDARDIFEWEVANREFHLALIAPCGMARLVTALTELHLASSRYLFAERRSASWQPQSDHAHRQIYEAMKKGQTEIAAALLYGHIRTAERLGRSPREPLGGESLVQAKAHSPGA
jgi:DNA-binding GntR family transcriptional regulator